MANPNIILWDESRKVEEESGWRMPFINKDLCNANELFLHVVSVKPGERRHLPHTHQGEEVLYLLEGQVEATIGDEVRTINAPGALFCPEGIVHGFRNNGKSDAKYMAIRALRPGVVPESMQTDRARS